MKSNVTPFFLILLAVAMFYAYINPQYAEINELRAEEGRYIDALDKAKQIEQLRTDLLTKYNNFTSSDIAKLETLLPDSVDNERLVLDLSTLGQSYGIEIKNIKIEKPLDTQPSDENAQVKAYGQAKVTFSFATSYENFLKFTKDIEQSLRIVDVSGINYRPSSTGNSEYTLIVSTYWLK